MTPVRRRRPHAGAALPAVAAWSRWRPPTGPRPEWWCVVDDRPPGRRRIRVATGGPPSGSRGTCSCSRRRPRPGSRPQRRLARRARRRGLDRLPRRRRAGAGRTGAPRCVATWRPPTRGSAGSQGRDRRCRCRPAAGPPTGSATPPAWPRRGGSPPTWPTAGTRWPPSAGSTSGSRAPSGRTPTWRCGCRTPAAGWRPAGGAPRTRCGRPAGGRACASSAGNADDVLMRRAARAGLGRAGRGLDRPAAAAPADHRRRAAGARWAARRGGRGRRCSARWPGPPEWPSSPGPGSRPGPRTAPR